MPLALRYKKTSENVRSARVAFPDTGKITEIKLRRVTAPEGQEAATHSEPYNLQKPGRLGWRVEWEGQAPPSRVYASQAAAKCRADSRLKDARREAKKAGRKLPIPAQEWDKRERRRLAAEKRREKAAEKREREAEKRRAQQMAGSLATVSHDSVKRAMEEFDKLGRDRFLAKYGYRKANRYMIKVDGKEYDSKAIVGVAFKYEPIGRPLSHKEFSGGPARLASILQACCDIRLQDKKTGRPVGVARIPVTKKVRKENGEGPKGRRPLRGSDFTAQEIAALVGLADAAIENWEGAESGAESSDSLKYWRSVRDLVRKGNVSASAAEDLIQYADPDATGPTGSALAKLKAAQKKGRAKKKSAKRPALTFPRTGERRFAGGWTANPAEVYTSIDRPGGPLRFQDAKKTSQTWRLVRGATRAERDAGISPPQLIVHRNKGGRRPDGTPAESGSVDLWEVRRGSELALTPRVRDWKGSASQLLKHYDRIFARQRGIDPDAPAQKKRREPVKSSRAGSSAGQASLIAPGAEGFALTSPRGTTRRTETPQGTQQTLGGVSRKVSREAMERMRTREIAERAAKRGAGVNGGAAPSVGASMATKPERMSQEQLIEVFDRLKPGQTVQVYAVAVMASSAPQWADLKVGRRSTSKRYSYTRIPLLRKGETKPPKFGGYTLYKRERKDGSRFVSLAWGDMGVDLWALRIAEPSPKPSKKKTAKKKAAKKKAPVRRKPKAPTMAEIRDRLEAIASAGGGALVYLTDAARDPLFRGVNFAKLQRAAEQLHKAERVAFDGATLTRIEKPRRPAADLALIWKHTHPDFRSTTVGGRDASGRSVGPQRWIMVNRGAQGSVLVPLEDLGPAEYDRALEYARKAEKRSGKPKPKDAARLLTSGRITEGRKFGRTGRSLGPRDPESKIPDSSSWRLRVERGGKEYSVRVSYGYKSKRWGLMSATSAGGRKVGSKTTQADLLRIAKAEILRTLPPEIERYDRFAEIVKRGGNPPVAGGYVQTKWADGKPGERSGLGAVPLAEYEAEQRKQRGAAVAAIPTVDPAPPREGPKVPERAALVSESRLRDLAQSKGDGGRVSFKVGKRHARRMGDVMEGEGIRAGEVPRTPWLRSASVPWWESEITATWQTRGNSVIVKFWTEPDGFLIGTVTATLPATRGGAWTFRTDRWGHDLAPFALARLAREADDRKRREAAKGKPGTFKHARATILEALESEGWTVKAGLKVPHATQENARKGQTGRVWLRPQTAYVQSGSPDGRFTAGAAMSTGIDLRELAKETPRAIADRLEEELRENEAFKRARR
jgi:5-methylcytosine-specific restriction protein A